MNKTARVISDIFNKETKGHLRRHASFIKIDKIGHDHATLFTICRSADPFKFKQLLVISRTVLATISG